MKFNEEASSEQATSSVLKRTHPDGVLNTSFENGVGSCMSLRAGGTKTATSKSPTMAPTNIHSIANICFKVLKTSSEQVQLDRQIVRGRSRREPDKHVDSVSYRKGLTGVVVGLVRPAGIEYHGVEWDCR